MPVSNGIRQGDSFSPLLFNTVMDEIIKQVRKLKGYKMGNKEIKILCYVDDAVLVAESKYDLQSLSHQFNKTAKKFNKYKIYDYLQDIDKMQACGRR